MRTKDLTCFLRLLTEITPLQSLFLFVCFSLYLLIWKRFVELTFCIVINVLEYGEEHVLKRLPASLKD